MTTVTDNEVTTIAQSIMRADNDAGTGRTTYLRALIGAAQEALDRKKGQEASVQLGALKTVHERFYELILTAAEEFVPRNMKDRNTELHRRANFARTALSALRSHVRAGADVVTLSPTKTTKAILKSPAGAQRPLTARRWRVKAERESKALIASIMGLADTDKAAAVEEIQLVLGQLAEQLVSLGVVSTKDAAQATAEHRPLRVGKTLFMPTASQVLQQTARPS